jgi:MFS transporter, DHA3 family, macrolide efflux protein
MPLFTKKRCVDTLKKLNQYPVFNFCAAGAFSSLGDLLYALILAWYISDEIQSGTLMGIILFSMGVSRFILGIVGGPIVDRIGSKKIMIISDLFRTAIVLIITILISNSLFPIPVIILASILFGSIDALYWPAAEAMKPQITKRELLSTLNSKYFTVLRVISTTGPLMAGIMISKYSVVASMIIIAFGYLLSVIFLLFLHLNSDEQKSAIQKSFKTDLLEGFSFVLNKREIMLMILTMFLVNIGANGITVVVPFWVLEISNSGELLGYLYTAMAIGSLVIGLIFSKIKISKVNLMHVIFSFFLQSFVIGLLFFANAPLSALVIIFFMGMFTGLIGIFIPTFIQLATPENYLGRVSSLMMTVSMTTTPIAQLVFGLLVDKVEIKYLFLTAGIVGCLSCFITLFLAMNLGLLNKNKLERVDM